MKKFFLYLIAIFMPWIGLLISDNPGGAIVALIMQVTIIGWPFAAYMAIQNIREFYELDKPKESTLKNDSD